MAKDKTRERKLPDWLKQRTDVTIKLSHATTMYYDLDALGSRWTWFDVYGAFRQGAKVRAA